tara:strand:+ start:98 stop:547 length:450 start_codon:yes stop_codon:yes gene_type:complete
MGYWEGAGQVAGIWLGATMALATLPVVAIDGPLPIADAAWLMANARNTDSLRRRGGRLGKQLDQYLEDDASSAMNNNLAVVSPETGSDRGPLAISTGAKIGGAPSFDSILNFDNLLTYDFSNIDFVLSTNPVQDLTYVNRNSQWPEWND